MIGKPHKKHFKGLTRLEARLLEKHFTITGITTSDGTQFKATLKVDQQSFVMGEYPFECSEDASWFCRQMTYALARLVQQYKP